MLNMLGLNRRPPPAILTFPPLCPLPFSKGGAYIRDRVRFSLEEDGYLYFTYNLVSIGVSALNCSVKQRSVVQAESRVDIIPYIMYAMPRRGQPKPRIDCLRQSSAC